MAVVGLAMRALRNRSAVGALFGLAVPMSYAAWVNRREGLGAPVFFNPVIYLVAAVVLLGVGAILVRRRWAPGTGPHGGWPRRG